jgi:hypothetical protein
MTFGRHCAPLLALLLLPCAHVTSQEEHPDRLKWLPGYSHDLPSPWYSGYLDYELNGVGVHTHYVYIEADSSEGDPSESPLIYWR